MMTDQQRVGAGSGYPAHRRQRALMGLRLTPAERLRWLDETMQTGADGREGPG